MEYGISKEIFYFLTEGRNNLPKTIELVIERSKQLQIKNIIVFTADGDGVLKLSEQLNNDKNIKIHAATFPYKHPFAVTDDNGNTTYKYAELSKKEVKEKLQNLGINIIQGVMPLQDIIIPGVKDIKTQTIHHTLSLISGGLRLCVQAVLMATDGGHIEPGEDVIAMSADTAIVAKSCRSSWLFHPNDGLEIREIICKPSTFTITHKQIED